MTRRINVAYDAVSYLETEIADFAECRTQVHSDDERAVGKEVEVCDTVKVARQLQHGFYVQTPPQHIFGSVEVFVRQLFKKNVGHKLVDVEVVVTVYERQLFFREFTVCIAQPQSAFATVASAFFLRAENIRSVKTQVVVYAGKEGNVVVVVKRYGGKFSLFGFCGDPQKMPVRYACCDYAYIGQRTRARKFLYFRACLDHEVISAPLARSDKVRGAFRTAQRLTDYLRFGAGHGQRDKRKEPDTSSEIA